MKEIPIAPGQQAQTAYYTGKILNLNPEFDQNAVESLDKALRLGPNNHNAWTELGKAAWKNQDMGHALTCFKVSMHLLFILHFSKFRRLSKNQKNPEHYATMPALFETKFQRRPTNVNG